MRALRRLDRHRRALLTLTAMLVVAGGAWTAVAAATASAVVHRTDATAPGLPGHRVSRAPAAPADPGATPPAPAPAVTAAPPASTSAAPLPVPKPAPVAAPAKPPASRPAPPPPGSAPLVAAPESTQAAQVAAALIASVDQQSHGTRSIPATPDNVGLVARWIMNEGGLRADNPLNTSHGAGGYPHQVTAGGQDTGIPIFPTMAVGVAADAATLLSNPRYARILHVLAGGKASCMAFATAVIRSPWASGHYGHNPLGFCTGNMTPKKVRGHRHRRAG